MAMIHVTELLRALDTPATMAELCAQTGYPPVKVYQYIVEARVAGHIIRADSRDKDSGPTLFRRVDE